MNDLTNTSRYRILIVDDNRAIHEDFCKILCARSEALELRDFELTLFGENDSTSLTRVTYDLEFAVQGEEAVRKVRDAVKENRPYALAFVDMRMPPGWDGLETIEHMWQVDPDIYTVICTAYSDYTWSDMVSRLAKREQWLLLKKPFDNVEVCQLAASLTRKWELHRQSLERLQELEELVEQRTAALREEIQRRRRAEEEFAEREVMMRMS